MSKKQAITVKELAAHIDAQIRMGRGDRKILISNDKDGSGYHELSFTFTAPDGIVRDGTVQLPSGMTGEEAIKEYIILG